MSSNISARGAASRFRSGTTSGGPAAKKPRTDGAKIGKQIFNVGQQSSYASIAIDNFLAKYRSGARILQKDIESLETAKDTVDQINPQLRNLVPQIADVPYLARTYDTSTVDERAKMRAALKMGKGTEAAVHSMKAFNKSIKEGTIANQDAKRSSPLSLPSTPTQPVRASSRVSVPILPPTVTPPPKSVDDILSKSRIGTADVISVLSSAKDYEERRRLVNELNDTGNLELRGEKGESVGKDMIWAAYCEATLPIPLGEYLGQPMFTNEQIHEHLLPHRPPSGNRSFEYAARIAAFLRTGKTYAKSGRGIRDIVERKSIIRAIGVTGKPKLDRNVVMEDAESVKQVHGSMYDEGSSKASLAKSATAAAVAAGNSALAVDLDSAVSTATARRVMIEHAMNNSDIQITDRRAIEKDDSRWVAEQSGRNVLAHAFVLAAAHYHIVPGKNRPLPPGYENFDPQKLSTGAQRLYDRIQSRHPSSTIYPVHPALVMGTDETGLVVVEGVAQSNEWKWRLVDATADTGTHSYYTDTAGTAKPGVLRVKLCLTTNAMGMVAAIWIVVSGLTEEELPREHCPSGVHVVQIDGLCPEAAKNPGATAVGFVVLTRKTTSDDEGVSIAQKKFREYYDRVMIPFVNECRRIVDRRYAGDASEFQHLRVVSWTDGDGPQIKQQLEDALTSRQRDISHCKFGARCSGCQAFSDLQPTHRSTKQVNNKLAASQLKVSPLAVRVKDVFKELRTEKKVVLKKERQLVEIIATAPDIYDRAVTKRGILHGFKVGGAIDEATRWAPDETRILKTLQRPLTQHEGDAYERGWSSVDPDVDFYGFALKTGKVPESAFDDAVVDEDKDRQGKTVLRPFEGTDQVDRQRSVILTHDGLTNQIKAKAQKSEDEKNEIARLEAARVNSILDQVDKIEVDLVGTLANAGNVAGGAIPTRRKMAEVVEKSLGAIANLPPAVLKMVIGAYLSDSGTKPAGQKWPNKYPTDSSGRKNVSDIKAVLDSCKDQTFNGHCLVSLLASIYRDRIERKLQRREEPQRITVDPFGRRQPHAATVTNVSASANLPEADAILNDGEMLERFGNAIKVLKMKDEFKLGQASAEEVKRAKKVTETLRQRHVGYKEGKLKEVGLGDKANHPVFKFAEDNFHCGGALLVAYEMVKEELAFISSGDAVLKPPSDEAFDDITGDILMYWGAYMYADVNLMAWIRSGKACGSTEESGRFKARIVAHLKAAKSEALGKGDGKITFYQRYVSKDIDPNIMERVQQAKVAKGIHEELEVKVGFAIDPNSDYSSLCDGSTFTWSEEILEYLKRKERPGFNALKEKQCELLCYFWEHMLELLMEKDKNVSWSAGWEAYIGVGKVVAEEECMEEDDE